MADGCQPYLGNYRSCLRWIRLWTVYPTDGVIKKWYLFYSTNKANEKLHQLGGELQNSDNKLNTKLQQLGAEIQETEHSPKMGLASYDKVRIKKIREALPSEEDLSRQLQLFENKRK